MLSVKEKKEVIKWKKQEKKQKFVFRAKRKKTDNKSFWALINPKNLQKEVHAFGYHFSEFTHILTIVFLLIASAGLGVIFQLKWEYTIIIACVAFCILPLFILDMYKRMYEQKRFAQAGQYVEQILFSFQDSQKIYFALHDSLIVFEDGIMKEKILEAIAYIDAGRAHTEKGIMWEALQIIELAFPSQKIKNTHQLLLSVEERGGDYNKSKKLLLESNSQWIRRGYTLQAEKKKRHMDVTFSIITSFILSLGVLYSLRWIGAISNRGGNIQIFNYPIIQITSCVFLILLIFIYYISSKSLTNDWLVEDGQKEKLTFSSYEYVMNYNETKEQIRSCIYAAIALGIGVVAYFVNYKWISAILFVVAIILLFSHKIGYSVSKNTVIKQLYLSFPKWLMDLALLLQNNNVYVSLNKSINHTDAIMQKELQELVARIDTNPNRLESYTKFLKKFDLPEVYTCMKMLYMIVESGEGDTSKQIGDILLQIQEMEKKAEQVMHEHIKFRLEKLFYYPIAAVCIKMTFDMGFGMVLMLASFQTFFQMK